MAKTVDRGRFQSAADLAAQGGYSIQWSGQGAGGSGKTHFLLTAPEPIAVMVFGDPNGVTTLMRKPEFKDKDISVINYNFQPGKLAGDDKQKAAEAELARFLDDYQTALKAFRTVGWDKEDQVYELLRYARFGSASERPSSYYELNLEYRGWFHDAAEAGVNLGVLRGMKEAWGKGDNGKPMALGRDVPRGQREVNEMVQVVLHHYWDDDARAFKVRVGGQQGDEPKCRIGPATELMGQEFDNMSFMELAALLYPEADESDWAA